MWLLSYFQHGSAKSSYQVHLSSPDDVRRTERAKRQKIATCTEDLHGLLSTYLTRNILSKPSNSVRRVRKNRFTAQEYTDELAERELKYGDVFRP